MPGAQFFAPRRPCQPCLSPAERGADTLAVWLGQPDWDCLEQWRVCRRPPYKSVSRFAQCSRANVSVPARPRPDWRPVPPAPRVSPMSTSIVQVASICSAPFSPRASLGRPAPLRPWNNFTACWQIWNLDCTCPLSRVGAVDNGDTSIQLSHEAAGQMRIHSRTAGHRSRRRQPMAHQGRVLMALETNPGPSL